MKKLPIFLLSFLVGILLFWAVIRFVGWQEIKKSILVFTGWQGLLILFLTFVWILIDNWKWKEILKGEGIDISFFSIVRPGLIGFSLMYLAPTFILGGEIFRGYILKKNHSLSWAKGMASVFLDRILDWTTNLLVVFFGMSFFLLKISLLPKKLGIILGSVFLFWLIGIAFFYAMVFKRESIARFVLRFINYKGQSNEPLEIEKEIFNFFKLKSTQFRKALGLAFLGESVMLLRIWFLISFLGKNISFFVALAISGFYYLATIIPIPASLGVQDVLQVFAFKALGLGANFGIAFTLIIRAAEVIVALVGVGLVPGLGLKLFENIVLKNNGANGIKDRNGIGDYPGS
jgi:uncharacterized protein (TIRG00374 family)